MTASGMSAPIVRIESSSSDCGECGRPVGWLNGAWYHRGGPFSGDDALAIMTHLARPKGEQCECCGKELLRKVVPTQ